MTKLIGNKCGILVISFVIFAIILTMDMIGEKDIGHGSTIFLQIAQDNLAAINPEFQ